MCPADGARSACISVSVRSARRRLRLCHVRMLLVREPGDLLFGSRRCDVGPRREGDEREPAMHEREKSDPPIVAAKPTNRAGQPDSEPVEPRAGAENSSHDGMYRFAISDYGDMNSNLIGPIALSERTLPMR